MILLTPLLNQLVPQLEDHPAFNSMHLVVTRSECVNTNINHTPWIGIYTKRVIHSPETITPSHRRFRGRVELVIVVQASSLLSGADCSDRLEVMIKETINAVLSDSTFSNSIEMINGIEVAYSFKQTDNISLHFQEAYIEIDLEVEHEDCDD